MSQSEIQNAQQRLEQARMEYELLIKQLLAAARAELAKSKMLLLLEPRGYGPRSEYRKACKSIMKNAKEVKRVVRQWRKALKEMGIKEDRPEILQALIEAENAKRELGFWGRLGL
jgi:hypothetical protein